MSDLPQLQHLLVQAADRQIRRRRPRRALRLTLALAAVALLVLALTHLPSQPVDREIAATTPSPAPTAVAPADAIKRAYGVFRRPAGPRDHLGKMPKPFDGTARLIASTATVDVFLILGKRDMCLWTRPKEGRGGGGGCGPRGTYVDGKRPIGSFSDEDGPSGVAFAFPDGVKQVKLTLADGTSATYPVVHNGFARELPARLVKLEWTAPDGEAQHSEFMHAPAFRAEDFYPALKRPETPADALDGLPGARLVEQSGDARAWLVPRLGAVCLVVRVADAQASGCRHKVADVRTPLIVALEPPGGARVIAIAFARGASRITLDGRRLTGDAFLLDRGHTLRYLSPGRTKLTDRLPAGGFTLHARPEPPTAIPQP